MPFATLKERERRYRRIVHMYTAKELGGLGMTLEAIGEEYGLTKERIRAILRKPPRQVGRPKKEG